MTPAIAYTQVALKVVTNIVLPGIIGLNNTNTGPVQSQLAILPVNFVAYGSNDASTCESVVTRILPDGYVAHPDIGTAYKIHADQATWKVARERCLAEGAHLAVIDTNLKLAFLIDQASYGKQDIGIHVGIHHMYNNTEWVIATDGSTLSDLPWVLPLNPNNSPENDIVIASPVRRGLWNCHHKCATHFACEIPIANN